VAYVVTDACIDEPQAECERVCGASAIRRGRFTRLIDPLACTDCGACEPVCPTGAIYPEAQVPAFARAWIARNAAWRAEGS
jgi:ferredoxin